MSEKRMSLGERKIADILTVAGLPFEQEYIFEGLTASSGRPLRFDFAVLNDDDSVWFLIEYQGQQHYEAVNHFGGGNALKKQKFNDRRKVDFCFENGYPLVVINYKDYQIMDYDFIMEKVFF